MADKNKTYIKLPEGFEAPEDLEDGGTFEAVVEIRKEGSKYCIDSVDGMELAGSDEEYDEAEEEESIGKRVKRMSLPEEEMVIEEEA